MSEPLDNDHPKIPSRYELIIVAAREARRLNQYYRSRGIQPKRRITSEAIERVFFGDGVPYVIASERPAVDDHPAEFSVDAGDSADV